MSFSELIINNNRVYHLDLAPHECATTIITVGDPHRVERVSSHFDEVECIREHREFVTHTGQYKGQCISVISTGIGTDNVDIVLNEVDALFNVDFDTKLPKSKHTTLDVIRIGTSGAIADIPVDSFLVSEAALGLDGLMYYYPQHKRYVDSHLFPAKPYYTQANADLLSKALAYEHVYGGLTLTTAGFYAPQGRSIRLQTNLDLDAISAASFYGQTPTNIEMETAGIYALSHLLGHRAISFNAILANRSQGVFSDDAENTIDALIKHVLNSMTS